MVQSPNQSKLNHITTSGGAIFFFFWGGGDEKLGKISTSKNKVRVILIFFFTRRHLFRFHSHNSRKLPSILIGTPSGFFCNYEYRYSVLFFLPCQLTKQQNPYFICVHAYLHFLKTSQLNKNLSIKSFVEKVLYYMNKFI